MVIDGTMCETWAVPQDFTPEAEVRAKQRKLASSGELSLPKPSYSRDRRGGRGRTPEPHQRPPRPANTHCCNRQAQHPQGVGFETIIVGVGRHATFQGDPRYVAFGDPLPPFITHVSVLSGLSDIALGAADALDRSSELAYNTETVIADRGSAGFRRSSGASTRQDAGW